MNVAMGSRISSIPATMRPGDSRLNRFEVEYIENKMWKSSTFQEESSNLQEPRGQEHHIQAYIWPYSNIIHILLYSTRTTSRSFSLLVVACPAAWSVAQWRALLYKVQNNAAPCRVAIYIYMCVQFSLSIFCILHCAKTSSCEQINSCYFVTSWSVLKISKSSLKSWARRDTR